MAARVHRAHLEEEIQWCREQQDQGTLDDKHAKLLLDTIEALKTLIDHPLDPNDLEIDLNVYKEPQEVAGVNVAVLEFLMTHNPRQVISKSMVYRVWASAVREPTIYDVVAMFAIGFGRFHPSSET
jgi:hypothetical protein